MLWTQTQWLKTLLSDSQKTSETESSRFRWPPQPKWFTGFSRFPEDPGRMSNAHVCESSTGFIPSNAPVTTTTSERAPLSHTYVASNTRLMRGGTQESWKGFHITKMNGLLRSLPLGVPPAWLLPTWVLPTWVAPQAALCKLRDGSSCWSLFQSNHPGSGGTSRFVEHVLATGPLELRDRRTEEENVYCQ